MRNRIFANLIEGGAENLVGALPSEPGVHVLAGVHVIIIDGKTAVAGVCICGAALPLMFIPPRVQVNQVTQAMLMLYKDTVSRCLEGLDFAPACAERRLRA